MGLRDDVKDRRHQKIRQLLEQYHESAEGDRSVQGMSNQRLQQENYERDNVVPDIQPPVYTDPEQAWKRNPNPWATWTEQDEKMPYGSYIKPAPIYEEHVEPPRQGGVRLLRELKWKLIIAALLFTGIWGMFQYDNEWTTVGQEYVHQALTDEYDFEAAAAWYQRTFAGAPSFIPIFQNEKQDAIGVEGTVKQPMASPLANASLIRTFAELLNGIELAGSSEAEVVAVETGQVILVTNNYESVLIQHVDNRISIYGKLGSAVVAVNDWVEAGDPIGRLKQADENGVSLLYFAVKQDEQYVDPLDVIPFD